jgi:hypothetical protein
MKRRDVIASATATIGLGGCLALRNENNSSENESPTDSKSDSCEIACFEFTHEGYDDAPDQLTIAHTEGRDLPAEEVFITDVIVGGRGRDSNWVIETVPWHEVDNTIKPTDGIAGESIHVDIGFPEVVQVLWRNENGERVLDETQPYG